MEKLFLYKEFLNEDELHEFENIENQLKTNEALSFPKRKTTPIPVIKNSKMENSQN